LVDRVLLGSLPNGSNSLESILVGGIRVLSLPLREFFLHEFVIW
jgi:hypothetical protein